MKSLYKVIIGVVVAVGIIVGGAAIWMHRTGYCHDRSNQDKIAWMVKKGSRSMQLDEAQTANLETLVVYLLPMRELMRDGLAGQKADMLALLEAPVLDQPRALAMVRKKTRLVEAEAPEIVAKIAAFTDSLNPEQKAELMEKMQRRGHYRRGHHGKKHREE